MAKFIVNQREKLSFINKLILNQIADLKSLHLFDTKYSLCNILHSRYNYLQSFDCDVCLAIFCSRKASENR